MSCETTREQLMELDAERFSEVEHLNSCDPCSAFADRIRSAEAAIAEHVALFEEGGDFESDWEHALEEGQPTEEVAGPSRGLYAMVGLVAGALILLGVSSRLLGGPSAAPDLPAEAVPGDPHSLSTPRGSQDAGAPSSTRSIVVDGLPGTVRAVEVRCPSGYAGRGIVSGGAGEVALVPDESTCVLSLDGEHGSRVVDSQTHFTWRDGRLEPR